MKNIYSELYADFPRQVGFPFRITCKNSSEFYKIINEKKTQKRVFASVYDYINNSFHIEKVLKLDKVFFDFDGLTQDVYDEVSLFSHELKEHNIRHLVCFSGGGFHIYVFTTGYTDIESKKGTLLNVHRYFIENYGLKNVDRAIVGDIARIATVPNTYNFKRKKFCIPLTQEELFDIDIEDTSDIGLKQVNLNRDYFIGKELFDISMFNTNEVQFDEIHENDIPDIDSKDENLSKLIFDELYINEIPDCIKKILREGELKYVGTYKRMLVIVYFRDHGMPIGNIVDIIKKYFTSRRKGIKECDHCLHERQLEFIYSSGYKYIFPSCETMKKNGNCKKEDFCKYCREYCNNIHMIKCYK